jgi:hypothetical protein
VQIKNIISYIITFFIGFILCGIIGGIVFYNISNKDAKRYAEATRQRDLVISGLENSLSKSNSIIDNITKSSLRLKQSSGRLTDTSRLITINAQRGLTIIDGLEKDQSDYRSSFQKGSIQK